jgi:hypothetical protein
MREILALRNMLFALMACCAVALFPACGTDGPPIGSDDDDDTVVGDDDDVVSDDDDTVGDDDDTTSAADPIGISVGIIVNALDQADWPEFEATIDGAPLEGDLFMVPADGAWHTIAVTAEGYLHAECTVSVVGDLLKVRVNHSDDYVTFYPEVSDFGHWDGSQVEYDYEHGDSLMVPLNKDMSGQWYCELGASPFEDWVGMDFGEVSAYFFEDVPMNVNGHQLFGPGYADNIFHYGAVDSTGFYGNRYVSDDVADVPTTEPGAAFSCIPM